MQQAAELISGLLGLRRSKKLRYAISRVDRVYRFGTGRCGHQ
jgi:hypothetical protein